MSLIWPDKKTDIILDQPRLHALVIGVGHYPHLNDGDPAALAQDPLGLSQVTTPPITAVKIASWLMENYKSTACPLGSVEVLLSPDQDIKRPDGTNIHAESARFSLIETAFNLWMKRCSAHGDNKAFFYFCGHGLNKGSQFILPEDFGDPNWADPWRNNIDFDLLRNGMRKCKARTQLFFVDACRETPFGMLSQITVTGQALSGGATFSDTVDCQAAYYATTEGKQAFGPPNDVTYFGQAVVKCLEGAGCINTNGQWIVDTSSLSTALHGLMRHLGRQNGLALSCNPNVSGLGTIHEPATAFVMVSIGCRNNTTADPFADIIMERGGDIRHSPAGKPKPMIEEVPPGDWNIKVSFPNRQFPGPVTWNQTLMPPTFEGVAAP
jgi:Caspase domain